MKKYDRYKDSGIEWIREIPERWTITRLANFGKFYKGKGVSKADLTDSGVPVILYGDIYTKYNIKTGVIERKTSDKVAQNSVLIIDGDLLLTASGETKEDIGKCICFTGSDEAYAGGDVIIYRQEQNSSLFLSYVFNSHNVVAQKAKLSKGEIVVHIYGSQLRNIFFALPPLSEQVQITSFLDEKISQIDSLITKKKKLISLLKEERTAIINKAVTKGIDPNVKYKESGIEWVDQIPEHWEVKKLKYIARLINEKSSNKPEYILALENLESWSGRIIGEPHSTRIEGEVNLFQKDDVLFNKLRPYLAKVTKASQDGGCVSELLVLRANDYVSPGFLYHRLLSEFIITIVDGSTYGTKMPRASWNNFISLIKIPVPPISEQQELVKFIEAKTSEIDSVISKTEIEIALIKEYKSALINDVVTGKIDVRDSVVHNQDKLQEAHQ